MSEEEDNELQTALAKAGTSMPPEMMAQVQLMIGMFSAAARYECESRKHEADRNADVQRDGIQAQKDRDMRWIEASDKADERRHARFKSLSWMGWVCLVGGLAIAGSLIYLREFQTLANLTLATGMYFAFRAGQKHPSQLPPPPPSDKAY